jgi:microcystin-dependent protein
MVERYADDLRATGAKAFFYQGGTTSLLTVFQDSGESSAHASPVVADANGRWPDVFIPYVVSYDVQVKSADDVQLTYSLQIPNPDPVDLSVVIPPEERIQTGMIISELVNSTRTGFVRLNGRTIGNPASLATERANTDTSALYTYLWNNLPNTVAPVSSGRGASAPADFSANKNIGLPDMRGKTFIGLDDMGNTAASAFSGLTFDIGSAIIAGSTIGANSVVLDSGQMPAHSHSGTTSSDGQHTHNVSTSVTTGTENQSIGVSVGGTTGTSNQDINHTHTYSYSSGVQNGAPGGGNLLTAGTTGTTSTPSFDINQHNHSFTASGGVTNAHNHSFSFSVNSGGVSVLHSHTFTTDTKGGTTPINNIPLARTVTWFIKL